jgi:hypothetical protein
MKVVLQGPCQALFVTRPTVFNRAFWVLRLSPFFRSIHTPHFRSRIGSLNSSRFIGLSFASGRHLC